MPQHAAREPGAISTGLTAGAVIAAVVLRWFHLGRQSLWFEGYTAWVFSLSVTDIVRFARKDVSPPLYYVLEHCWVYLFGNTESALRGLSALFGTLSLPVFYLLAKKILNDSMAVALAMWLFAFSIMQLWFSQEARTYEVASFFSLLALYALILFLEKRSVALFATIILSITATLYMHNMMFFYLFVLNFRGGISPSTIREAVFRREASGDFAFCLNLEDQLTMKKWRVIFSTLEPPGKWCKQERVLAHWPFLVVHRVWRKPPTLLVSHVQHYEGDCFALAAAIVEFGGPQVIL